MSLGLGRQKALPDIRVDIDASSNVAGDEEHWVLSSSRIRTPANTNKALPSIKVENALSDEEMRRLHELWNGAGLSARAHRRRQRGQPPTPRRIPAPISIPVPDDIPPTLSSADPSMTSTTPPTTTRKRRGFLSARPFTSTQGTEKKVPNALERVCSMAQSRLKKKLRYAKSAPNLGDQTRPSAREVQPAVPIRVQAAPKQVEAGDPRISSSPGELATPEAVLLQPEDMDKTAIYFTIDPNWRASRGSVKFQFITPIPNSPTSLGRPDSPLLHRHHSLDQLSSAAQEGTKTLIAVEFPEGYPSDAI